MTEKPVVLVLGAGASQPFGFPSGHELLRAIVEATKHPQQTDIGKVLCETWGVSYIGEFSNALRLSGRNSVDAFLENRTDFMEIGKVAIAAALRPFEKPYQVFDTGDWYRYLFNLLSGPGAFENFARNKIAIITFNYDRSLEFYLLESLKNSFQKKAEEREALFCKIPIIHVYGQLGSLLGSDPVPFTGTLDEPRRVNFISRQIKIIHESEDNTEEFVAAREYLNNAEVVCFLGFGYHERNVQRLLKGVDLKSKRIYGTGYDITKAERVQIGSHFPGIELRWGDKQDKVLDFLRKQGPLLSQVHKITDNHFTE
jgi:hypothetical protein